MIQFRHSIPLLFLSFISLLAILGSLIYLLFGLTPLSLSLALILSLTSSFFLYHIYQKIPPTPITEKPINWNKITASLTLVYLLCFFYGIYCLLSNRSDQALISPWEVVPAIFFLFYGLATALLWCLSSRLPKIFESLLFFLHFLWSFSIVLIIYKVGYGYDPFIHQAAVKAIKELGRIYPTTFYYLGQYSLVTISQTIFGGSIAFWDKILVPLLAPCVLITSFLRLKNNQTIKNYTSVVLLLLFPISIFILTTPQNLAYIFLLALILWSINLKDSRELIIIWLLALASFITQPIAGIPAFLLATSLTVNFNQQKLFKKGLNTLLLFTYLLILPLAFYVLSQTDTSTAVHLQWPDLKNLFSFAILKNPVKENWWLNLIYFFQASRGLIFVCVVISGFCIAFYQKLNSYVRHYGLPMIALIFSAIISASVNFHFLIDYERSDYPERILFVASLFSLPFIILAFENFTEKLSKKTTYFQISWVIGIAALVTTSLYLSYPRFDHYYNSHGYATSLADISAVHWIADKAGTQDYIVLANQQVSAAALREFGFKKYYNNFFYYPIPTGGPLYQYYLKMVEKPQRSTVEEAMKLAGVKKAYFVLNDYWWAADKLGPEAAAIADQNATISNNRIQIFEYNLK